MKTTMITFAVASLMVTTMAAAQEISTREMRVTYVARVDNLPADAKGVEVWIPLPSSNRHQTVSNVEVDSDLVWRQFSEQTYGNQYLYTVLDEVASPELEVRITFDIDRRIALFDRLRSQDVSQEERRRNLMPDTLVTLSPRVVKLAREVTAGSKGTMEEARALYHYVLDTMEYDKSKPGWGRGDTERACDIRSGNCTDFHSLFISLARAREIPARFIMGVPVASAASGEATGYHCWAEFYLDGKGWVPVDISEAWKSQDPAVQNFLFGNLDFDRVEFSVGRDLRLRNQSGPPLNYFIAPYVEVNGKSWPDSAMKVEYRNRAMQRPKTTRR